MASITNKRKTGCGSNSDGSSNASSPSVTASLNNSSGAPFYPHLTANAPKNGVVIPNRVFVGGIASTTTEAELTAFFSKYGQVKDVKIIVDRGGISKGYGFVTFDSEEEANKLQQAADDVNFQGRRLNIAAAIKKQVCILQPYNRSFDASSTSPTMPPNVYYHNGIQYTYQNGMAFFSPGNPPTNAIAPVQAHPESVSMYQGTFGPPHGSTAAPSFGPTMMYHPCPPNPPPPVYLPTQQYAYQPLPVASQSSGIMFSAGAGPANITNASSAQNSSLVPIGDNGSSTQTVQLIPTPTGSIYAAPHILHDVHYSAQSIYPVTAVESLPQHNEVQTIESPPSNVSTEGSLCSKAEPENTISTTSSETKTNETPQTLTTVTSTATPVVSWLHCSERYESTKAVNDRHVIASENSHEQPTTATVYPVMFNPFSRPPTARHPFPSTVNGYSDNYSRVRNFVPYVYNVEPRRPSNPNVPKQQIVNHNNNYIANNNYSVKTADVSNQTRNSPRLPRYPKVRPLVPTPPNFRFMPPYCPRFGYYPPHFLPLPPPQIAASRRFTGPSCRRQNVYIPVSSSINNMSNSNTASYDNSSTTCSKNSSTVNHNNNNSNYTNNNSNTTNNNNNNNVGSNGGVKIAKSVTSKAEPESGALCGAGDAPSSSHPTNIAVPGPTPLELSHQMQKLST